MDIYLDNAATTYPKPDSVLQAMEDYFKNVGGSFGRSAHKRSNEASRLVFESREEIAKLVQAEDSSQIIFTSNATEGLNAAILGILGEGDRVVTTSMEHNSVMRPLRFLQKEKGVKVDIVKCTRKGMLDWDDMEKKVAIDTQLIVATAVSNVVGTIMPIHQMGMIARERDIPFLVDGAQAVGIIPMDVKKDNIDLLAFSGHKGVLGPQGTGCLYIGEDIDLRPLKFGGTGSRSEYEMQPDFLPDKHESGTPNLIGIVGLGAAVKFVLEQGVENIRRKGKELTAYLLGKLNAMDNLIIYGPLNADQQTSVISINIKLKDSSEIGDILDKRYDIAVRCGLHCAPIAHRTIGTFPAGTVRISLGYFNTQEDIDYLLRALREIAT